MSTPTEERGDLLIMNIRKHQTDCILDVRSRILMHHPTYMGNRKQPFFPMNAKRRRNTSQACLNQRRHFSHFVVGFMSRSAWKGSQSSTAKPCRKPRQEIRKVSFRNYKLPEVKDEHCNCTMQTGYTFEVHASPL